MGLQSNMCVWGPGVSGSNWLRPRTEPAPSFLSAHSSSSMSDNEPKKGTYFVHDVVGMTVVDEHDNNIGTIKDVLRFPAQDVYLVEHNGNEWMIPAVKEFVDSIDVASKTMRVRLIDGLVDR
ncbi:MAG: rimM [Bacteroidetes bacterium]|nr:rimM [Bacteroidota bacterium]